MSLRYACASGTLAPILRYGPDMLPGYAPYCFVNYLSAMVDRDLPSPVCFPAEGFPQDEYDKFVRGHPAYNFRKETAHEVVSVWFTPTDEELARRLEHRNRVEAQTAEERRHRASTLVLCALVEMVHRGEDIRDLDSEVSDVHIGAIDRFNALELGYRASIVPILPTLAPAFGVARLAAFRVEKLL